MLKKLVVLGTGGTIAGGSSCASDNVGYRSAQVDIGELLHAVPGLQNVLDGHVLLSEQVIQVDSKDIGWEHWRTLLSRVQHYLQHPDVASLVITHGTDTLEETAFFLANVLPASLLANRSVVLTCAMRPASSLAPDGPQNLRDAVSVAVNGDARGVLVVCAGSVHAARDVQKTHPYRVDAFDSGEAGPLGVVEEGRVRWFHPHSHVCGEVSPMALDRLMMPVWPRVEIVASHAGANGDMVRAICVQRPGVDSVRGIVVAATGNGTIHADLESALQEARSQGIQVVRSTRCAQGSIVPGGSLANSFPCSKAPSAVKARIELILELLRQR